MSVLIAEAVLLVLLIGISILIIVDQRLMSSVITYCAFSFAAMLLYTIVGAADVAFTEEHVKDKLYRIMRETYGA